MQEEKQGTIRGLSPFHRALKRGFDIVAAFFGLVLTGWIILVASIAASTDTRQNGFFRQTRVGMNGKHFKVVKIRTMRDIPRYTTTVTRSDDPRITRLGKFFRRTKIDELPQLWNVLVGDMSFVGPRPDIPGYADLLVGVDRIILSVRPGITGPATLKFRDEEALLARQADPEKYNRNVIYPEKMRINREYIETYRFWKDFLYIFLTVLGK
jgi:lipopolysaccharide/colanic/teichoic acid biosynthesis glycosyltransferase